MEEKTICIATGAQLPDLLAAVAQELSLSSTEAKHVRLFTSNAFDAKPVNQVTLDAHYSAGGSVGFDVRFSNIRYVQYGNEIVEVPDNDKKTYLHLRNHCMTLFGLTGAPREHIALFLPTPEKVHSIDLNMRLPDIDADSAAGFSLKNPILLKRTDQLKVHIGGAHHIISIAGCKTYEAVAEVIRKVLFPEVASTLSLQLYKPQNVPVDLNLEVKPFSPDYKERVIYAFRTDRLKVHIGGEEHIISIAGCKTYKAVAEVIRKLAFPNATCAQQIQLYHSDKVLVNLDDSIMQSQGTEQVLTAKMISRMVHIIPEGLEWPSDYNIAAVLRNIKSDAQIAKLSNGLLEINENGDVIDTRLIHEVHLLKDGATYLATVHSHIDNDIAFEIRAMLDQNNTFLCLPRKIRDYAAVQQEWDAVFYDPVKDRVIFAEVKRKLAASDFAKIWERFKKLDKPRTLVIVSVIFERKAAEAVLQELAKASSQTEIHLCYPNGTRYSLHANVQEVSRDYEMEAFIIPA